MHAARSHMTKKAGWHMHLFFSNPHPWDSQLQKLFTHKLKHKKTWHVVYNLRHCYETYFKQAGKCRTTYWCTVTKQCLHAKLSGTFCSSSAVPWSIITGMQLNPIDAYQVTTSQLLRHGRAVPVKCSLLHFKLIVYFVVLQKLICVRNGEKSYTWLNWHCRLSYYILLCTCTTIFYTS